MNTKKTIFSSRLLRVTKYSLIVVSNLILNQALSSEEWKTFKLNREKVDRYNIEVTSTCEDICFLKVAAPGNIEGHLYKYTQIIIDENINFPNLSMNLSGKLERSLYRFSIPKNLCEKVDIMLIYKDKNYVNKPIFSHGDPRHIFWFSLDENCDVGKLE